MKVLVKQFDNLDFTFAPWSWAFAEEHRREINEFFRQECERNPTLWNGRLLLLRDVSTTGGSMSGVFFETDYASLLAGLAWGTMGDTVKACFPAAAIRASDGAFIVGEMAEFTWNAGQVLFPSGSVERADVAGNRVNFFGTLCRELMEETGIASDELEPESAWYAVTIDPRLPLIKIMRSKEAAELLKQRISANLAGQSRPEFRKVFVVRDTSDLSDQMPLWVTAFFQHVWRP